MHIYNYVTQYSVYTYTKVIKYQKVNTDRIPTNTQWNHILQSVIIILKMHEVNSVHTRTCMQQWLALLHTSFYQTSECFPQKYVLGNTLIYLERYKNDTETGSELIWNKLDCETKIVLIDVAGRNLQ
jgi:hypothetical protein